MSPSLPRLPFALGSFLVAALALAGCYAKAKPAIPKAELPPLVDGEIVQVELDSDEEAVVTGSRVRWEKNYRIDGMSYGDTSLTYHQVRTLTDPTWQKKLDEHAAEVRACRRANVPRYIGYAAVVAGLGVQTYGFLLLKDKPELIAPVGYGLMGFGGVSYLTGWAFFGGRSCNRANELWDEMHLGKANDTSIYSDALIGELGEIILKFNKDQQRLARQKAEAGDDGDEEIDDSDETTEQ